MTTTYSDEWESPYACARHPVLPPDAWSQVQAKRLQGDGAKASLVCRFACRVRNSCPFGDHGREIIAKGGWFGSDGGFFKPPEDMLELRQAAAYLALDYPYFVSLLHKKGIPVTRAGFYNSFVSLEDVYKLAESRPGPKHGSADRYELHLLRGEVPCQSCKMVGQRLEGAARASLLRR